MSGNYIVTLETKQKRSIDDSLYLRVYCNWEQCSQGTPPLRARIAGRVTPTGSQIGDNALDMIEIPVKYSIISSFACCQETGNIIIASKCILSIFRMVIKTHDISRLRFLDFDTWPMVINLKFNVYNLQIEQDIVAVFGEQKIQVFQILKDIKKNSDWSSNTSSMKTSSIQEQPEVLPSGPIDLNQLLKSKNDNYLWKLVNPICFPIMMITPGFDNSVLAEQEENAPFNIVSMPITINETKANDPWSEPICWTVKMILQLELNMSRCNITNENIKSVLLNLVYRRHETSKVLEWNFPRFRTETYNHLTCVNCLISLKEEAFVFHSLVSHEKNEVKIAPAQCITVYNFISPVINIFMDRSVLHVLTTTSLETYTIRLFPSSSPSPSQILSERVTLIGHKPFLGIVDMVLLENKLIIFTSANSNLDNRVNNNWTLYMLTLPSPNSICKVLSFKARITRFKSPNKYIHLIKEALNLADIVENYVYRSCGSARLGANDFKKFCCLVADYYFLFKKEGWEWSYRLYEKANLQPIDVFVRMKQLNDMYERVKRPVDTIPAIKFYIRSWIHDHPEQVDLKTLVYGIKMAEKSGDLLYVAELVLSEESTRKLPLHNVIKHLENNLEASYEWKGALTFSLLFLYSLSNIETKDVSDVYNEADEISNKSFVQYCKSYSNLLIEQDSSFSDFSLILMQETPILIAHGFAEIVSSSQSIKLRKIIQAFQKYIGSHMYSTNVTDVFKKFLELHFSCSYGHDKKPDLNKKYVCDAIKILFRQYLTDLTKPISENCTQTNSRDRKSIYNSQIPGYIQMLPCYNNNNENLFKLQSLFYTNWLTKDFIEDIKQVLPLMNKSSLSLEIMASTNTMKTIEIVVDKCPQAVLKYSMVSI
uniref:BLOC-2 complex member HPS3 N-terminal domain-containing protein n=1 Tax=Sipha flava TaxID=143950 RepID=A0A2S2QZG9_9HEMI